jgi:hypothetical protein
VIDQRITARIASYQLLRRLVEENALAAGTRLQDQKQLGWWSWLERLEHELRKEKQLLHPEWPGYISVPEQREQRMLSMATELAVKQDRSNAALKLVLKFKFNEHSRAKANSDDSFQRLVHASFPPELLSMVFKALVKSQVTHLFVHQATSLTTVAKTICSQWPRHLGSDGRSLMDQTAIRAMLEHSLIEISTYFTSQHTIIVPPTLQGSEQFLRHLVLEVQSTPRDGASNGKLNQVIESIGNLKLQFPNLEVCIVLLHIIHEREKGPTLGQGGSIESIRSTRTIRRVNGAYKVTTLEDSIVGFINAFMERGPGERKFIRISHQGYRPDPTYYTYIGPMVRLCSPPSDASSTGESTLIVNAKRIFDAAYQNWIPRK